MPADEDPAAGPPGARAPRSPAALIVAVVLSLIAERTQQTSEDIHEFCKGNFITRKWITMGTVNVEISKTTTDLDTLQMERYLQQIRNWSETELKLVIPNPNEV